MTLADSTHSRARPRLDRHAPAGLRPPGGMRSVDPRQAPEGGRRRSRCRRSVTERAMRGGPAACATFPHSTDKFTHEEAPTRRHDRTRPRRRGWRRARVRTNHGRPGRRRRGPASGRAAAGTVLLPLPRRADPDRRRQPGRADRPAPPGAQPRGLDAGDGRGRGRQDAARRRPPTGRRRTRDAPRSALGFHRQLRLLHRRRPGLRADAATDAPRARQHAARPARRRLHAHRSLPGRADRRQRLRQYGQHAVPRVDADGALHRGGRAGRGTDAAVRTGDRGRAPGARAGVHRHARRRTRRRGSGRAGAPPLPGAGLSPSVRRQRTWHGRSPVPRGAAVGAGVQGRREGGPAGDSDFTEVPPAHRDAPGDGGPRALPHKRLGPGLAPLLLSVGVDARRRAARSRPPRRAERPGRARSAGRPDAGRPQGRHPRHQLRRAVARLPAGRHADLARSNRQSVVHRHADDRDARRVVDVLPVAHPRQPADPPAHRRRLHLRERGARHTLYGMEGIEGEHMRRVPRSTTRTAGATSATAASSR